MQMMQIGLHQARVAFQTLQATSPPELDDAKRAWYETAFAVTSELLHTAPRLGADAEGPIFNTDEAPKPTPVMRIVPDV